MRKFFSRLFSSSNNSKTASASPNQRGENGPDQIDEYHYDHYTNAVEDIKQLKREKRHDEAEDLLLWCIDFAEAEDQVGLPRWYYKHLGIVYRKENRYEDEVEILERYVENTTSPRQEILDRLERARELAGDD
ncbi:hypothetical protein [Natrinema salifodinae]|uniref:Tetratricopeptide repeat-containing protein n=1 Tax=Natrinema salifodinae TaxID=1202768 RepID=A0A1I0P7E1_9EURY|nr:hypothetical protein [Natrinema salifodinae]SEW10001.1 hypothetical protein SAMN05216285_2212 [Natrinema salifodinae]